MRIAYRMHQVVLYLKLLAYVTVFVLEHSDFGINYSQSLQPSQCFATSAALVQPSIPFFSPKVNLSKSRFSFCFSPPFCSVKPKKKKTFVDSHLT